MGSATSLAVTVYAVLQLCNVTSHDPIVGLAEVEVFVARALDIHNHSGISTRSVCHVGRQLGYQLEKCSNGGLKKRWDKWIQRSTHVYHLLGQNGYKDKRVVNTSQYIPCDR